MGLFINRKELTMVHQRVSVCGAPHDVQVLNEDAPGTPLLLRNGVGASARVLEHIADHLPGRPILIVESVQLGLPLALKTLLMAAAVRKAGFEEIDVLGASYGGAEAQQLALTSALRSRLNPMVPVPRVRRMVLVSTGPNAVPGKPSAVLGLTAATAVPGLQRRLARTIHGDVADRADVMELVGGHRASRYKVASNVVSLMGWSSVPFLALLELPVKVIHGDDDRLVPHVNARIMARLLPNADLELWPGEGHLLVLTKAAEVGKSIVDFLDDDVGEATLSEPLLRLAA
jgi:pimeloyl-ACP methyl ester carboxylesterase